MIKLRFDAFEYGETWSAEVIFEKPKSDADWTHYQVRTEGSSNKAAFNAARYILDLFAKGRSAAIRVWPEAISERNFDTKIEKHAGFVRFSVLNQPGTWSDVSSKIIAKIPQA